MLRISPQKNEQTTWTKSGNPSMFDEEIVINSVSMIGFRMIMAYHCTTVKTSVELHDGVNMFGTLLGSVQYHPIPNLLSHCRFPLLLRTNKACLTICCSSETQDLPITAACNENLF